MEKIISGMAFTGDVLRQMYNLLLSVPDGTAFSTSNCNEHPQIDIVIHLQKKLEELIEQMHEDNSGMGFIWDKTRIDTPEDPTAKLCKWSTEYKGIRVNLFCDVNAQVKYTAKFQY